jgi:hypothetical protein
MNIKNTFSTRAIKKMHCAFHILRNQKMNIKNNIKRVIFNKSIYSRKRNKRRRSWRRIFRGGDGSKNI